MTIDEWKSLVLALPVIAVPFAVRLGILRVLKMTLLCALALNIAPYVVFVAWGLFEGESPAVVVAEMHRLGYLDMVVRIMGQAAVWLGVGLAVAVVLRRAFPALTESRA